MEVFRRLRFFMSLKQLMTNDINVFFNTDEFCSTVSYNSSNITAIWTLKENLKEESYSNMKQGELVIKVSDVSDPNYRDTIVIDSTTWYMRRVLYGDGYTWTLLLETEERPAI